jgi:hypothetical protein
MSGRVQDEVRDGMMLDMKRTRTADHSWRACFRRVVSQLYAGTRSTYIKVGDIPSIIIML